MAEDRRTPGDIKNGWTLEAFNAYHAERERAAQQSCDWFGRPPKRPKMQSKGKWRPWRGLRGV